MGEVKHFSYTSADHLTSIHAMRWQPDGRIKGIIQITHGMLEFIERYDHFANWMSERGYMVVGHDLLGHGDSVRSKGRRGFFAHGEPDLVHIQDMNTLQQMMQQEYPDVPYIMLGHSMGSFLVREYLCLYGDCIDGAIISGTAYHPAVEAIAGKAICQILARRKGWMYRSPFVTKLAMGSFNKKFEPARTRNDWLSRDAAVVDAYNADERTQFTFTLNGYYGMFRSLRYLTVRSHLEKMPKDLPVYFIAGEMDPVGNFGEGVKKVMMEFHACGMNHVECSIYPNDRHEVLNEIDKLDVYEDIRKWTEKQVIAPMADQRR